MAETIKIGGELESTATGNKVADIANVKDKTKGNKSQAEINAETETALADRYTKAETYNKSELNNMITTPEIDYKDYDTYADMVAETNHPAGAIYRVANYDGTQAVNNKYAEYSWDGTQYKLMAVRDHGIDDEPTAGSGNLVKSGGVSEVVDNIKQDVFNYDIQDWEYERKVSWGSSPGSNYPVIDYLGKVKCTFTIRNGAAGNKYKINAKNKASGNIVTLYTVTDASYPITFDNPRTDLELIDVVINTLSTSAADSIDITITKSNPIISINEKVSDLKNFDESLKIELFNRDKKDWTYKKAVKVVVGSNALILSDLGKQEFTVKVSGTVISNNIVVYGVNRATGNSLNIGTASGEITYPLEFNNPRPDLDYSGVYLRVNSEGGTTDTFNVEISKDSPIAQLDSRVGINEKDISSLKEGDTLLKGTVAINLPTSSTYQRVNLKAGRSYSLYCNNNGTITIWNEDKSEKAGANITASTAVTKFFVPTADVYWIKCGNAFTGTLQETLSVNNLNARISAVESNAGDAVIETQLQSNGVEINLPTSSVYQHISFKKGSVYCIVTDETSSTRTLTIWPEDKSASIKSFTPIASKPTNPYVFTVDSNEGYWIKAGGAYKGKLYYYPDINKLMQARFKSPAYQFGVGINCRYETPLCPAYVNPEVGQRVAYFHGLYDALVASYPNYVTKVDCDAECVAAGIERPAYMNDYPIYMYKFIPKYTPAGAAFDSDDSQKSKLKAFIVSGTHPEYMSMYDLYLTMKAICENWASNDNLDALRWEAEYYVIPCSGPWGIDNGSRVNYNGVDLNRNAPASNWQLTEDDGNTYSGPEPASEYETKVLVHYMEEIKPQVFIDHHNFSDNNKNIMYVTCREKVGIDLGAAHISDMTRRWKKRFNTIFPNDDVIYGFAQKTNEPGTRGWYGCDSGALGFTYESCSSYKYTNGVYDHNNWHSNDENAVTMATDGFLNFLLRVLKTYSEIH